MRYHSLLLNLLEIPFPYFHSAQCNAYPGSYISYHLLSTYHDLYSSSVVTLFSYEAVGSVKVIVLISGKVGAGPQV